MENKTNQPVVQGQMHELLAPLRRFILKRKKRVIAQKFWEYFSQSNMAEKMAMVGMGSTLDLIAMKQVVKMELAGEESQEVNGNDR